MSSSQWRIHPLLLRTHRRVVLALPIIAVLLAVCLWQRWYVPLMLVALCTLTNVLMLHFFFNESAPIPPALPGRSPVSLPRVASTAPAQRKALPTMTFPETPMPATPLIRVLETIDLSSTDVEHFLELTERSHRTETSPPPQEYPQQHLE